jgi:hypothetical protein
MALLVAAVLHLTEVNLLLHGLGINTKIYRSLQRFVDA